MDTWKPGCLRAVIARTLGVGAQGEAHSDFGAERTPGPVRFDGEWAIGEFAAVHAIGIIHPLNQQLVR